VGLGGAIGVFAGLFLGPRSHRRLRSWLAFTVLVAAWLTLFVSWQELAC
jgi:gas vesicle protein